jgi:hypothetical protein
MRIGWLILLAALAGTACGPDVSLSAPAGSAPAAPELSVVALDPASRSAIPRDQAVELIFNEPLDPSSLRPGTVRVVRRDGQEQPVEVRVDARRLVLKPPAPFGFARHMEYAVVVEGFPSPLALRSVRGRALNAPFRTTFTTSRAYRTDLESPRVDGIDLEADDSGGWSVHIRFSEPVDPRTVVPGQTLHVRPDGLPTDLPGRVIADRRSAWYRFLPGAAARPHEIRVTLTSGITDLAGNPLSTGYGAEASFDLVPASGQSSDGEIAEDFTSKDYLDPAQTTALWDGVRSPGVLLAEPAPTVLTLPGEPDQTEAYFGLGATETRIRILLTREELGVPRQLTGLVWAPSGAGFVPAEYSDLEIRITPTTRSSLDDPGPDLEPPRVVLRRSPWRIEAGEWERICVPFSESYAWDGESNLLLEITVGPGDHTNFLHAWHSKSGRAVVEQNGRRAAIRPVLSFRGFSWKPIATSRFYDSGIESPRYMAPVVQPSVLPGGVEMTLWFQGAHRLDPDGRSPPVDTSDWVTDPTVLSGYRYLRFRVEFSGVSPSGEEAAVDDLIVPFTRSR